MPSISPSDSPLLVRKQIPNEINLIGIIGFPIKHSQSPQFHNNAFESLKLPFKYFAFEANPENFERVISELRTARFKGFNVTIPFKIRILSYLDKVTDDAKLIGAVNTVVYENGIWIGHNTDVYGVSCALEPIANRLKNSSAVILGAGGGARAVMASLIQEFHLSHITIISRSIQKGIELKNNFSQVNQDCIIGVIEWNEENITKAIQSSMLIVNSTPLGMSPNVDSSPLPLDFCFKSSQITFDLVYNPLETTFLKTAKLSGATAISGEEMFLNQAAKAFELWTGKKMIRNESRILS